MIVCAAYADDVDTLSASLPLPESIPVNYTGAVISAFIPGGGQVYMGRYLSGGLFLVAEAAAIGYGAYWFGEAKHGRNETARMSDSVSANGTRWLLTGDNAWLNRMVQYSVLADIADFEAREAKFTAYSGLSWAIGIHLYSFLNALDAGGVGSSVRGRYRDPTIAGFLAAVPFLGLGQFYNGYPGKAGMISMTQISLAVMAGGHHALMNQASAKYNEMREPDSPKNAHAAEHLSYWKSRYDQNFSRRNTYLWVSLFAYIYTIFDAVVDAHLSDYEDKIGIGADLAAGVDGIGVILTYRF